MFHKFENFKLHSMQNSKSDIRKGSRMGFKKLKQVLTMAVVLAICMPQVVRSQTVSGALHNEFVGYGLTSLYLYWTPQANGASFSSTHPMKVVKLNPAGQFSFNLPIPSSSVIASAGLSARGFLSQYGIYGNNIVVSNNATLLPIDIRACVNGRLSEYFGPAVGPYSRHKGMAMYVYATDNVRFSGKSSKNMTIDMTFVPGWNMVVLSYDKSDPCIITALVDWPWGSD